MNMYLVRTCQLKCLAIFLIHGNIKWWGRINLSACCGHFSNVKKIKKLQSALT